MKKKLISIIIVNWNGKKWLKKCLESLKSQSYSSFEVIFVDNNSLDGSVGYVRKYFPWVTVIENDKNDGFARGNNIGYQHAEGEYILLLNNDTYVEKDFLKHFLDAFAKYPKAGSVQSKLILMDDHSKLDMVGAYWTNTTFLYYYGFGKRQDEEKYNKPMKFFSNKGASMMIKREVIKKVGLFDDDFWNYYEETDFCHRVWLAGYECWYWPKAVAYHALGGTSTQINNAYIQYHNFKNKLLSFLKNFSVLTLLRVIPIYITICVGLSVFWLIQGKFGHFLAIFKAMGWNIKNILNTFNKRKTIQEMRQVSDSFILYHTTLSPRFHYYKLLFNGNITCYEE